VKLTAEGDVELMSSSTPLECGDLSPLCYAATCRRDAFIEATPTFKGQAKATTKSPCFFEFFQKKIQETTLRWCYVSEEEIRRNKKPTSNVINMRLAFLHELVESEDNRGQPNWGESLC
jgi:hypothetical protein